jgi:predicted metalloprotease with PDZ domain
MRKEIFLTGPLFLSIAIGIHGQHPLTHWTDPVEVRYASSQPVIRYVVTVNDGDTSSFSVEMQLRNLPKTFLVAMVAHSEYDDKYWRYLKDISVTANHSTGTATRTDSAVWRVSVSGSEATIRYRIALPPGKEGMRSAWKAYLSSTGGLIGGPHSFLFIVGQTLAASYVTLKLPAGWKACTGLESTSDPSTFFAPSTALLVDDPIFVGQFQDWHFSIDGVPHRVIYWSQPQTPPIDSVALVNGIKHIAEQALSVFKRFPYRDFTFMLQDGAFGSLEHNNSVTVGAPASRLNTDIGETFSEIAHEYFHTWNLVRFHPVEYGDVDYRKPPLSNGLWFSEGFTMFYADLL